ncbi:MAG: hypothetical protein IPK97_08410 [Ahniella sp.]|nr:hypothetical protein [Ahniella sp.]
MIFAQATDNQSLLVFPNADAAIAYCEGIDVAEDGWRFWASFGEPLEAVFSTPASRGRFLVSSGVYTLVPGSDTEALPLQQSIAGIRILEPNPFFDTVASVQNYLSQSGSVKHGGA